MSVEFSICGGYLRILKKTFVREMLSPTSTLKKLLNYELEDSDKKRFVTIDKTKETDVVIIDFNYANNVCVGEDYKNLVYELKEKFKDDIKGKIVLSSFYYNLLTITLDLNSVDGTIKMIC